MTKGFYNLTSGMLSQSRRLDVVSNNMTNLTTPQAIRRNSTRTAPFRKC